MTTVRLQLPQEIIDELDIPYEGIRDVQGIVVTIDGINFAASLVTLAALRPRAQEFVKALRNWRLRERQASITMVVKGPNIDLRIELPQNASTSQLLDQLRPLLDGPPAS